MPLKIAFNQMLKILIQDYVTPILIG
jgi:hypothetical protein